MKELPEISWPKVENHPRWGYFEVKISIDSHEFTAQIPALTFESYAQCKEMEDKYFQETKSPLIAYRFGNRGMYNVRVNSLTLSVTKMLSRVGENEPKELDGNKYYERHLLDGRDSSLEIIGKLNKTGKKFSAMFYYVPSFSVSM